MAKKTPVKKSKRGLKRSVRRSLAAVLMITAIGVAAVPVPENYAEEEDITTPADEHIHDTKKDGYGYKETGLLIGEGENQKQDTSFDEPTRANNGNIDLGKHKGESASQQLGDTTNPVQPSLATTEVESGLYSLSWQFLFYKVTVPSGGDRGVISLYNNDYSTDELTLNMAPVTEYYTVEENDFYAYFDADYGLTEESEEEEEEEEDKKEVLISKAHSDIVKRMGGIDPAVEYTYLYSDYDAKTTTPTWLQGFLERYCSGPGEIYSQITASYTKYEADLAAWRASTDPNKGDAPTPAEFTFIPADDLDTDEMMSFYCDNDPKIKNLGKGYTLSRVSDSRPDGRSDTGYVLLARGGTPNTDMGAGNDKNGFLYTGTSGYLMCAIGDGAFKGISNVKNLSLPSMIGYIGDEAFMNADLMESIQIANVTNIGNRAFKDCVRLSEVNIEQGTKVIGAECFSGTALQSIDLPSSLETIGYGAFYNCLNLTTLNLNTINTACVLKDYAFYNCSALTGIEMAESNIIALGKGAFAVVGGSQPMDIVLPQRMSSTATVDGKSVNSLGDYLFAGRANLQSVVFPPNYGRNASPATKIPGAMFHNCANLKYVEFPATVSDQYACGYLTYDSGALFADVSNINFYVKGPKENGSGKGSVASPRQATWDAVTSVSSTVPYLYVENGREYYEVSDGFYLLCVNDDGVLTSCTFKATLTQSDWNRWRDKDPMWVNGENKGGENGRLEIPSTVGNTKVLTIASDCFSDTQLNRRVRELIISDKSITSIADGSFQGGGGPDKNDWLNLQQVYIGNSVTSIGNNAFRNCKKLIDVTFSTPLSGYDSFSIGENAFTTQSDELTFHGDIVEGYAPFDWAMNPDNIIEDVNDIRVCYKSLSPTYLTVMYNPVTEMVTLLDYPKYEEISQILNEAHADDIDEWNGLHSGAHVSTYEEMKAAEWYARYAGPDYDTDRIEFIQAWLSGEDADKLYALDLYGPWINDVVVSNDKDNGWEYWVKRAQDAKLTSDNRKGSALIDWLFEPINAYAIASAPEAYYKHNPYNVALIVDANDPYRAPTAEEQGLVYYTKNIEVPAGVQSIDVYGYVNNLTADGEKTTGKAVNTGNYRLYLRERWDTPSRKMYETPSSDPDEDGIRSVPGLFSGDYDDGDAALKESRVRGNDVIQSVTMKSVKYLPDYAFDSCEGLNYVILGPDCADIGKAPFRGCYSLTTVGDNDYYTTVNGIIYSNNTDDEGNPDGTLMIEECLAARGNLVGQAVFNSFSDPNMFNVSNIRPGAFEDCDYLTEVNFGIKDTAGLKVIPEDCFKNCDSLQRVYLPMTVNDVEKGVFAGADGLSDLTFYGKEVKISASAFDTGKGWTTVHAYEDSAVVRYVKEYGDEFKLRMYDIPLGELWRVSFYDANYVLIEELKDKSGNDLDNPQYVEDGARPIEPENPVMEGWTFERWVGMNNVNLGDAIHEDASFYAQGYSESGMVGGKYPVSFWDGIDGTQVGPTQYIEPGSDAIPPAHPVHTGYDPDGYSDTYTNVQAAKTIIMKYKPIGTTSGGSGTTPGGSTTTSDKTTSNTSNTSNTSSSNSTSTTSTSSDGSTQNMGMYVVTVIGGSGSGSYSAGQTVQITANTPAAGSVFSKWVTDSQGVSLASVSTTPTTFTMPANNVTITAEYTVAPATPTGTNGTGSTGNTGNTGNGSTRVDITKPGISNKDLATANVNGSTDNFVVKITETDEATRAVADALANKYGSLDNILYYAMDISLYDSTGTVKITDTSGLSVDITIPIPDALVAYGGNNMAGAVINGNQLESLNENFTIINGVPCIRFTATHFSPYTVYVDTGNLTEGMLDVTPKTGDPIHPKWFLSLGLACLSVILFMKKDKNVKVKTA